MLKIGRYEVESEIGRGAMGVVYRAHDPQLHRQVAVKTYALPDGLDDGKKVEFRERFQREARAAAALSHPGIVTVYDAGEDAGSGLPFIAMELVPGRSLGELLQEEGAQPLDRVAGMADTLADALRAAHEAGIVHRDIKPANILVHETDGSVKIADFGIARVSSSTLTQSGSSIGSPAYMSPEQIRARKLDGRSDLFSLAVILYELLCGERPFGGDDPSEVVYSVVHETPIPISRRNPELNGSLDSFFDRALAKEPERRFRDGREFRRGFADAAGGPTSVDPRATVQVALHTVADEPGRSRRGPIAAAAALVVLVGGFMFCGEKDAYLELDGKSSINGDLALLIDGKEVYERELTAPKQPRGQKKGLFKKIKHSVAGPDHETFEAYIEIDPGKHEIQATVVPENGEPYRDTVVVDLEPGETRKLKLVAGGKLGSLLSLRVP